MLKLIIKFFLLVSCCTASLPLLGTQHYHEIYPPVLQRLDGSSIFWGDRHGEFEGDYVALLSDGSAWKVHPDCRNKYTNWQVGEIVRIKVRTDFYWFKREHKFALYNHNRGEEVNVMLAQHINYPMPLQIVSVEEYAKSQRLVAVPHYVVRFNSQGNLVTDVVYTYEWQPCEFRKILLLSDGSFWVIKDKFNSFAMGTHVYIGAQGRPKKHYDFVLISGNEREAEWTYARPQK